MGSFFLEISDIYLFALVLVFLLGASVGSFLNVVILRYGTGRSLSGRSSCASCGGELAWHDLVPVLSFVWLRGRCRLCGSGLSLQYPLVELATGISFAVLFSALFDGVFTMPFVVSMLYAAVAASLLIVIFVYDIHHMIIPDMPVYALIVLSFAALFVDGTLAFSVPSSTALIAGPTVAFPLAALWLVSRGRWLGLGDAKLALALGWLVGLSVGVAAFLLSFWIGAVVSVTVLLMQHLMQGAQLFGRERALTMKSEIPFAPFIVIGFTVAWLFEIDIITMLFTLFPSVV